MANHQVYGHGSTNIGVTSAHRTAKIVAAVMVSIPCYVAIGLIVLKIKSPNPDSSARIPIYVAALFIALGSVALRRSQMRWLRLSTVAEVRGARGLVNHLVRTTIVVAGLADLIGLLGLVLCFTGGGDVRDILILGAVALLIVLPVFPRRRIWEKTVAELSPAIPESDADIA